MDRETAARFDALEAQQASRWQLVVDIAGQLEVMQQRTDERFARLLDAMDARFDAVDSRFDEERAWAESKFDGVSNEFRRQRAFVAGQFEEMQRRIDERFDAFAAANDLRASSVERRVRALEEK